ncbi:MAG: uroporphyrinogen-III C-methyltransferase [Alphaproteobacteria bacterium]|nr:uroporphyrinogen-III C-methyltransferase [Alphaproteobacteria bacterium]
MAGDACRANSNSHNSDECENRPALSAEGRCPQPGEVWLVGAGPGDPDLLTIGALRAIREATACVYDALVSDQVLDFLPSHALRVFAGKRGGRPSPTQEDISQRLIALAREGHAVVRLKGGDPLIFGRGMEEVSALSNSGIQARVIPGITSGIGGLAWAGIPLTNRSTNSVVSLLTGTSASSIHVNWQAIAASGSVVLIYMGLKQLPTIAMNLLRHGRSPDEAVVFVSHATTADQQVLVSTLGTAERDVAQVAAPALIVIGVDTQDIGILQKTVFSDLSASFIDACGLRSNVKDS